ncbi:hypothetical protein [Streptosporangium sp. OZ121]|uniref:hypothetical protein n=1 Tax=Streptosporangium sp. OZ121 TaxID=3444183 RepID=UPI003F794859
MISRDNATLARDAAYYAIRAVQTHTEDCDSCSPEPETKPEPCKVIGHYRANADKLCAEARHALTAYAPKGTQVIYQGMHEEFHGEYTVTGPARHCAWGAYDLTRDDGQVLHAAPLNSVHLTEAAAAERDRMNAARAAVAAVLQVLESRGLVLKVTVDRTDNGKVFIAWSSLDFFRLQQRAAMMESAETRQYLAGAFRLLTTLRTAAQRDRSEEVKKVTTTARAILARTTTRRNTPRA